MEGHRIIKAMRLYLGMSQREAAEKLGIYLSVYQKYGKKACDLYELQFHTITQLQEEEKSLVLKDDVIITHENILTCSVLIPVSARCADCQYVILEFVLHYADAVILLKCDF